MPETRRVTMESLEEQIRLLTQQMETFMRIQDDQNQILTKRLDEQSKKHEDNSKKHEGNIAQLQRTIDRSPEMRPQHSLQQIPTDARITAETELQQLREQWNESYDCWKSQADSTGEHTEYDTQAVMTQRPPELENHQTNPQPQADSSSTAEIGNNNTFFKFLSSTPKLELECPKFDGSNPRNWIQKCGRYMELLKFPDYQRVDIASLYMVGKAEKWMCSYLSTRRGVCWNEFVMDLLGKFGDEGVDVCESNGNLEVVIESAMKLDIEEDSVSGDMHTDTHTNCCADRVGVNDNDVHHVFDEVTDPLLGNEIDVEVGGGPNEDAVVCDCVAKAVVGVTEELNLVLADEATVVWVVVAGAELMLNDENETPELKALVAVAVGVDVMGVGVEAVALVTVGNQVWEAVPKLIVEVVIIFDPGGCAFDDLMALDLGKQVHNCVSVNKVEFDYVLGSALINMYGKCSNIDGANQVLNKMTNPDNISLIVPVVNYTKYSEMNDASKIFYTKQGVHNVVSWTAIINEYVKNGEIEEAAKLGGYAQVGDTLKVVRLLCQLAKEWIKPNEYTFFTVINSCDNPMATVKQGKQLHARSVKSGHHKALCVSSALVTWYAKGGNIVSVNEIFKKAEEEGSSFMEFNDLWIFTAWLWEKALANSDPKLVMKGITHGACDYLVDGHFGIHVSSISCGTWPTTVVTSDGQLFTFGDGSFGVLGHGDRRNIYKPREVDSLKGLYTVQAACGVWHTTAAAKLSEEQMIKTAFVYSDMEFVFSLEVKTVSRGEY